MTVCVGVRLCDVVCAQVSSIFALLLFYVFGYRPAIVQLDKDMRRTREMLLMFPDDVINGVDRIRAMIQEITTQLL